MACSAARFLRSRAARLRRCRSRARSPLATAVGRYCAAAVRFCAVPLPLLAADFPLLLTAFVLLGIGIGALDVAMNAHAVLVEERYRRPIMSSFHGLFSLGGLVGAVLVAGAMAVGVPPVEHLGRCSRRSCAGSTSCAARACRRRDGSATK